ncbi:efflux RND transporter periplasmic adaptor subunit [uncultured Neptuniibacter sp.]|uniref:efflux RND transporter periplasmic adaptor subunit n=1 Tax=uncultured Neptuniibacter sp. TaxID=502143 RepID=UPI002636A5CA|nr:efflux RND transporter periplasmic adaptor subunit [uncultured Neptuniibacter sp.]
MRLLIGSLLLVIGSASSAATHVVVAPLSSLLNSTSHTAPARVVNDEHAQISARINAEVESVKVRVGDQVSEGQVLATLDCRDHQLAREQADSVLKTLYAQSRLARQQLERAEKLLKQRNASRELRDQRRAELDSLLAQQKGAKAALNMAVLTVERCSTKAPFDGVVTERVVSSGDLVAPGSVLIRLLALSGQEVEAALNQEQVVRLQSASEVAFILQGKRFPLQLRAIIPLVKSKARTQNVRFSFQQQAALSGSSGRIEWFDLKGRLPARYVVSRDGQLGLMRLENGTAVFEPLPEAIEGQAVEVDLPADSLIIVEGQHAVTDQEAVTAGEQE